MDSVTEYLQADHRRLDGIMTRCHEQASREDMVSARATFHEFKEGLTRHIRIEEELLFPAFEEATGLGTEAGPTAVMRDEHQRILAMLASVETLFDGSSPTFGGLTPLCTSLVSLLGEHNEKEEQIIYPGTDRAVPPARLHDLVNRMRAF